MKDDFVAVKTIKNYFDGPRNVKVCGGKIPVSLKVNKQVSIRITQK